MRRMGRTRKFGGKVYSYIGAAFAYSDVKKTKEKYEKDWHIIVVKNEDRKSGEQYWKIWARRRHAHTRITY